MAELDDDISRSRHDKDNTLGHSSDSIFNNHPEILDENEQQRRIHHRVVKRFTLYQIVLVLAIFGRSALIQFLPDFPKDYLHLDENYTNRLRNYLNAAAIAIGAFIVMAYTSSTCT